MRQETRRRLERTLWLERAKQLAFALACAAAIATLVVYVYAHKSEDALLEERTVPATVKFWQFTGRQSGGNPLLSITATLSDGRDVLAGSAAHETTQKGDQIQLDEKRYKSGRITYVWK